MAYRSATHGVWRLPVKQPGTPSNPTDGIFGNHRSEDTPLRRSLPPAQGNERIEYHPVDLQARAECARARAKCPFGRNADVINACVSCHTVPGSDRPFAGGREIQTPFGNIVAPNITPDRDTGIGAWSDAEFDAAVRKGVRRAGGLLYPAMPYNAFTKLSRDDVLAIRAYLNTVTPVSNAVVANRRVGWSSPRPPSTLRRRTSRHR